MLADFGREFEHMLEARAVLEGAFAGTLDYGTIGQRIAEWDAEFDYARACFNGSENDFACGGKIGVTAGYIGDERRFAFEVKRHGSFVISYLLVSI